MESIFLAASLLIVTPIFAFNGFPPSLELREKNAFVPFPATHINQNRHDFINGEYSISPSFIATGYKEPLMNMDAIGANNQYIYNRRKYQQPYLTPYTKTLYKLLTSAGIFGKLFDVSFTPRQAEKAYLNAAMYFATHLGVRSPLPIVENVARAAGQAFKRGGVTPMNYFQAFGNLMEDYLAQKGYLTKENTYSWAFSHFKAWANSVAHDGIINDPTASLYAVTRGDVNFLKSIGMTPDEAKIMLLIFIDQMNNI